MSGGPLMLCGCGAILVPVPGGLACGHCDLGPCPGCDDCRATAARNDHHEVEARVLDALAELA